MSTATNSSFSEVHRQRAERLKALAHPARLAIVELLARYDECVCGEIVDDLPLAQSTVSQHLKALKDAGLVQGTIEGRRTCYCLDTEALRILEEDLDDFFCALDRSSSPTTCC